MAPPMPPTKNNYKSDRPDSGSTLINVNIHHTSHSPGYVFHRPLVCGMTGIIDASLSLIRISGFYTSET